MLDRHFRRTRRVHHADIDELGHVNNLVWVRFVVDLATAHSDALGIGTDVYRALASWWIVHRHEIDYHAPALPGEEIVEETWVSRMRGARSVRESRFSRARDDARLVSARTVWAYVDAETHKPRRIDRQILEAFAAVDEEDAEPRRVRSR